MSESTKSVLFNLADHHETSEINQVEMEVIVGVKVLAFLPPSHLK